MKTEILTHSDRYWNTHKLKVKENQKNVVKWSQQILDNGGIGKTKPQKNLLKKNMSEEVTLGEIIFRENVLE